MKDGIMALYEMVHRSANLPLLDFMDHASFDELVKISLLEDHYEYIYNIQEKYDMGTMQGSYRDYFAFFRENLIHPEDRYAYAQFMDPEKLEQNLLTEEHSALDFSFRIKTPEGEWHWVEQVVVGGEANLCPPGVCYCYVMDIQNRKDREQGHNRVEWQRKDELTGLVKAHDFFLAADRLMQKDRDWMMLVIDIEQFGLFNEWYGRGTGDQVLRWIGQELLEEAKGTLGYAGYMGNDDFALLVPEGTVEPRTVYQRIHDAISEYGVSIGFMPAIGISLAKGSISSQSLYDQALVACKKAKTSFKQRIRVFDSSMYDQVSEEYRILSDFQRALGNWELTFFLQPQCRANTGTIVGAESLARWIRPDGTIIPPGKFVPVLEKYGFITDLDMHIWERVCQWLHRLREQGRELIPVSVNISQIDFFTIDVPQFLRALAEKYEIPEGILKLEITESACAEDSGKIREAVEELRRMGFAIYMDDFGSGYSSLNMLRSMKLDVIKLDAQFLHIAKEEEKKGISILESVINMAKNLTTPIIVEGVENEQQIDFLRSAGCTYMQGYYFYRPMSMGDFERLIADDSLVDHGGLVFQHNQQIRVREFLDENLFSDSMLNNVLGPVAFYNWDGENIDIIRFNEQFYEVVGIDTTDFAARRIHLQKYLYPGDFELFKRLFEEAQEHTSLGSTGVIRTFRPNGAIVALRLRVFYMGSDVQGKKFYASAQDVTEEEILNIDIPGAYYRCDTSEDFVFLHISRNFERLTGYTRKEIQNLFGNRFIRLVHPGDVPVLRSQCRAILAGKPVSLSPFRLMTRRGQIYVADQSQISDRFGPLCWQGMLIDVTEQMRLREQSRLLTSYLACCLFFLHKKGDTFLYEVVVNGLKEELGMESGELERSINSGEFCRMIEGYDPSVPHHTYTERFVSSILGEPREITLTLENGTKRNLLAYADNVSDAYTSVDYIVVLRKL